MTPSQALLLTESFAKLMPRAPQVAALFYERLFAIAPDVRPMFKGDMTELGRKLFQTIGFVIGHLDRLETAMPAVRALGHQHHEFGVRDEHYDSVEAALLWAFEQTLGAEFTPAMRQAWQSVYALLADAMKQAAHQAA